MPTECCEFVDSRLRRSPPDRASAVPYGQAGDKLPSIKIKTSMVDLVLRNAASARVALCCPLERCAMEASGPFRCSLPFR
jgi:hypothetical protein